MRTLIPVVLAFFFLLQPAAAPLQADEKEQADDLVTRLFNVSALTQGRTDFMRELTPSLGGEGGEDQPLFGSEGEEPWYPVGQVDELIELVKVHVQPESWESTMGADIRGMGESTLVVRSFPEVVDAVATFLGSLQRQVMRRVVVDVETYRLTSSEVAGLLQQGSAQLVDPAKLSPLRGGDAAGPSCSLASYERHRAAIYTGRQRSYIADYDVEVAVKASGTDPIVHVTNLGLSVDLRTTLGKDGKSAVVVVDAALSELLSNRMVQVGDAAVIETPDHAVATILSRVDVPVGSWSLIDGHSQDGGDPRWVFLVRVRALPGEDLSPVARSIPLRSPAARPARRFELRTIDVGMLQETGGSRAGESVFLTPSNFTPPEPPELPEPMPLFPADALVELIRESVVPGSWEMRGAGIEARNGYLYVRNSSEVLDALEANLERLQGEFLWSLVTTSEVVDLPTRLAHRLQASAGAQLDAAGRREIEAAISSGAARRMGSTRVVNMRGGRNHAAAGRRISYVADYEIEIAESALIGNPVVQNCFSGTGLDIQPALTAGGRSVQLEMRFVRTHLKTPMRRVACPYGDIDVPEMDVFRARLATHAPLGKTMILASAGSGGRHQLLLVTSRLGRSKR